MNIPAKNLILSGKIFFLTSTFLFAGMLYFGSDTMSFKNSSVETEGTIVGYAENGTKGEDKNTEPDYYPVIEYTDTAGRSYRINSDTVMNYEVFLFIKARESGFTNPLYKVPPVKIRYSRGNPGEARPVRSFFDLWGTTVAYAILALVFSITGTALMQIGDTEKK